MGRYPDTDETRFFEISKVCPNIDTYDNFEKVLDVYLNNKMEKHDFSEYEKILNQHYTSKRILKL
jgi:ribosome-binding protein aMBF1 (putative translation factor)